MTENTKWIILAIVLLVSHKTYAIVDMKNANYSHTWIDIEVPGSGYDLKVIRTYNSRSLFDGVFGFGWCSNFETELKFNSKTSLKVVECGAGQETTFNAEKGGAGVEGAKFYSASNKADSIVFQKGMYNRQLPDGSSMRFDASGNLVLVYDKNGNFLKIESQGGLIRSIVDNNGRRLTYSYNQNKKIKTIVGPNGLKAEYTYSNLVDLAAVKNGWGNTYKYEYDDLHNLTKTTYPDGSTVVLTYDRERDWVTSFQDRNKCIEKYSYDFSKTAPKFHYWANVIKTCSGKIVNESKHEFWFKEKQSGDAFLSRVLSVINGNATEVVYHEEFNRPTLIRRNNELTRFEYSKMGQVIKKSTPGSRLLYSYDPKTNKVSKVEIQFLDDKGAVRQSRVTEFKYDNKLNLVNARDSDGRNIDMAYDEKGRIIQVKDQTKKLVKITYEEKFGKPKEIERPGLGKVFITYKPSGEIDKVRSKDGSAVAMQVASTFNNMLEIIAPATAEIYN